ncbi:activating transcription factor 7-interacting protein 2 [Pseudophryne corroboree]|uniref:activating transcription factor 7-interacting protein 2 n=1 Tax=Pseudophryne corroboree TaxID=495146 RepID=UPI003081AE7C
MEAAGVGCAAASDMGSLVANTNGSAKKIFRARKTMSASCRQQMSVLNKIKHSSKVESVVSETVQDGDLMCIAQDNSNNIFSNGLKVSIEVSQVDSEFNIGCSYNETWKEITKQSEDRSSVLLAPVKGSIHFSHSAHFQVKETSNAVVEPDLDGLNQVTSPPNSGNQILREKAVQTSGNSTEQDFKTDFQQSNFGECSTISENLNASITLKIVSEDKSLAKPSSMGLVTPVSVLPAASSNSVIPSNERDASCSTGTSVAPACIVNSTTDTDTGGCERKRPLSDNNDVPERKRAKTSNKVLLNEIQCLIDSRMQNFFKETFEQRMQDLTQQVNLIQCNGNHADKIARHLRNIKKLEKHIKYAIEVQNTVGNGSSRLPSVSFACDELPTTETTPSVSNITPSAESEIPPSRKPSTQSVDTNRMELVVLSDHESGQQSKAEQSATDGPCISSKKVDNAADTTGAVQSPEVAVRNGLRIQAMRKIMESIKEHRSKAQSSITDKQAKTVIDLTDDEEQRSDKDLKLDDKCSPPHEKLSTPPVPTPETVTVEKVPDKDVEKREEVSINNKNEVSSSYDTEERRQPIPKSPKSKKPRDSMSLTKTPLKPEAGMLKLPQKPELRLAQVQNPKGIALSWNVSSVDPSCSPAIAYCLYVHQEDPNSSKKLWKKIGEIKALPLPMACTLTQFVDDTTYYFAMRAKDASGRFGPLCDIQSTTVKPVSAPKKI